MTNYAVLGEYTAYAEQAKDSARRRHTYLHSMANALSKLAERPEEIADTARLNEGVADILGADAEMRAALERANQAAPLCHKPALKLQDLKL